MDLNNQKWKIFHPLPFYRYESSVGAIFIFCPLWIWNINNLQKQIQPDNVVS